MPAVNTASLLYCVVKPLTAPNPRPHFFMKLFRKRGCVHAWPFTQRLTIWFHEEFLTSTYLLFLLSERNVNSLRG